MTPKTPRQSLNKVFLKVKLHRKALDDFKTKLAELLQRAEANPKESEEFHKNVLAEFLKKTYYDPDHYLNTKGRNDLVIHNGKNTKSTVGVIIEAKSPTNKHEMPKALKNKFDLNTKAFHELLLYFLRERITQQNLEIRHLVITNLYEWFIFDATDVDRLFAQNKKFVKQFEDFAEGRLIDKKTELFYQNIAAPFIAKHQEELPYTYFDLREFMVVGGDTNNGGGVGRDTNNGGGVGRDTNNDDRKLIALYKVFSPEHLLKLPFANDSNTLDRGFYSELLHLIGLTEVKQKGKKIIQRQAKAKRHPASLLESTILQLETLDKIRRLPNAKQYGDTYEERLFTVALELCITWVNRILFLKLLEAQLIAYNSSTPSPLGEGRGEVKTNYAFLQFSKIGSYDALNKLFFQVLAKIPEARSEAIQAEFAQVPYLNSSLFEPTELEHATLYISNLDGDTELDLFSATVLKDANGKRRSGKQHPLSYFFAFLDAYDFSTQGGEEIQEENKTLINAAVLGLIFEKINGYRDGSFFTPGFITMYMCRQTLRRAVVQKFNSVKGWNCRSLDEVYDKIEDRQEANEILNSLKICDPAVGSGHFLVSALNELIAIKHELRILQDRTGKRLKEYRFEVINDELVITDEDGDLFAYKPQHPESQRVQEAIFHEKQTLIENCLFGVDINPNSVKICRLRLWIELLKHAYYRSNPSARSLTVAEDSTPSATTKRLADRSLETLPNIDINIKAGNSLISRFALDANIKAALKKSDWSIEDYQNAVRKYRNATGKDEKYEMVELIERIKSDFRTEVAKSDPKRKRLNETRGKLIALQTQTGMFGLSKAEEKKRKKDEKILTKRIAELEAAIEDLESNRIYENAFEWRFEFPEVLDENGNFLGFDVVLGNPPYIRQEEIKEFKPHLQSRFETYAGTADLFVYFVELAMNKLKPQGQFTFIIPNKWMRAGYGKALRRYLQDLRIEEILDFGDLPVFEEATTYPCILALRKATPVSQFRAANIETLEFPEGMQNYISQNQIEVLTEELPETGWTLVDSRVQQLLAKLRQKGTPLGEYVDGQIFYGIKTGYNEAFVIDRATKDRLISEDPKSAEVIKPFLAGRDIKRYQQPKSDKFLILFKNGETKSWFGDLPEEQAWLKLSEKYEAVSRYLKQFEVKAKKRYDQGQYWWELRACDYYEEFEKEKIIIPAIVKGASYAFDIESHYSNDKTSIIPTEDKNLVALLNSTLVDFFLKNIAATRRGGYFEYKPVYVHQLPIIETESLAPLVTQILALKKSDPDADTSALEGEIDQLVYQLYGLSEEEIRIVEG